MLVFALVERFSVSRLSIFVKIIFERGLKITHTKVSSSSIVVYYKSKSIELIILPQFTVFRHLHMLHCSSTLFVLTLHVIGSVIEIL